MTTRRRVGRAVAALTLAGAVGYGVGVAQPYLWRPPLVVGQDAAVPGGGAAVSRVAEAGGRVLVVAPADAAPRVAFVLYPGGLIRPQAYEWLGRALASAGVTTLIPEFALDLPLTDPGRAARVADALTPGVPLVVGGHSLGGAMAAGHAEGAAGLVLLAAYPPPSVDLSDTDLPTLVLLAEHDGVVAAREVTDGVRRLPAGCRLVTVAGAVHSFFGRYGPQAGDGVPTVTRAAAEDRIVAELTGFFAALP